jgi:hypothetical protein
MILFSQDSGSKLLLGDEVKLVETSTSTALSIGDIPDGQPLIRVEDSIVGQPFKFEARTDDPPAPTVGAVWIRTDL